MKKKKNKKFGILYVQETCTVATLYSALKKLQVLFKMDISIRDILVDDILDYKIILEFGGRVKPVFQMVNGKMCQTGMIIGHSEIGNPIIANMDPEIIIDLTEEDEN